MNVNLIFPPFWAAILLLSHSLLAQQLQIHTYGTRDGIPQSEVDAIYQDRDGQIWFGTFENGLARYDGETMRAYTLSQGLPNLSIRSIFEDRLGNIWAGTEGGLARISRDGAIRAFTVQHGLPANSVNQVAQDSSGRLWITTNAGLCLWQGNDPSLASSDNAAQPAPAYFTSYSPEGSAAAATIRAIAVGPDNLLWLGTEDGLLQFRETRFIVPPEAVRLQGKVIRAVLLAHDQTLWIGTTVGLFCLREGRLSSFKMSDDPAGEDVFSLAQDQKKNIWIGARSGLHKYDGSTFSSYDTRHGLPNSYIRSLFVDYENNLWLGTWGGGAAKVYGWTISNFNRSSGLPSDAVFSFMQDRAGRIWIGTNGGGAAIVSGEDIEILNTDNVLPDNVVRGMGMTSSGEVWLTTNGGAARLQNGKWRVYTARDRLPDNRLRNVHITAGGDVWLSSAFKGAIRFRHEEFWNLNSSNGLPGDGVHQVYEDRKKRLWVATNRGLYLNENGKAHIFSLREGLPDSAIYTIFEDHTGAMWFGTRAGGAARFINGSFEIFNTENGLPNNVVYLIAEDDQQRIWLGTNAGVACYDGKSFFYLHASDGLLDDECNTRAVLKDREGYLWIGTVGGASRITTALLPATAPPPRVKITALESSGQETHWGDAKPVQLPYKSTVTFKFATLSHINEDKVSNRVFLEGFDEDWIALEQQRSIRYTNLSPKRYTFHMSGANALGIPSAQAARVQIEILSPFYLKPWFLILCAFATGGLVIGGHRWRVRHVKARAEELEKAVAAKTEELQNTLTFLSTVEDFLPLGLLVVDAKENIVEANRTALEMFEYELAALRGRQLFNVLNSPLSSREAMWRALTQKKTGLELVALTQSGKHFICEVHSDAVMDAAGRLRFLILTCENIETQKQLERKVIDNEKQLALVNLVMGMGEVLNQKLSGMHGHVQKLHERLAQDRAPETLGLLQSTEGSIQEMDKVLRQLLEFTAYLAKTPSIAVDLRQELLALAERWQKKIAVAVPLMPEPIPLRILPKLRDGLDEALQNSLDAGAANVKVEVELMLDHARVRVLLSDDGEGIASEIRDRAFLPFFKTRGTPHAGLGLWKLYQVVKQCGGTVELDNTPAGGTQLRLTMPLDSPKYYANASVQAEEARHARHRS